MGKRLRRVKHLLTDATFEIQLTPPAQGASGTPSRTVAGKPSRTVAEKPSRTVAGKPSRTVAEAKPSKPAPEVYVGSRRLPEDEAQRFVSEVKGMGEKAVHAVVAAGALGMGALLATLISH